MNIVMRAEHVSKKVENSLILNDMSFELKKNEAVALIGHNGSGKSSLLKLLAGIYEPSEGTIYRDFQKYGYVPEHFPEHIRFKLKEYLVQMGKISGLSPNELHSEIDKYAERFGITEYFQTPLRECSKGTKQKAGIIQALLSKANVLFFDEPFTGLDSDSQHQLNIILLEIKKEHTIIFTVHEEEAVEQIADRVIVLKKGKIHSDTISAYREKRMLIKVKTPELFSDKNLLSLDIRSTFKDNILESVTEKRHADQLLLNMLQNGCSVIEVKAIGDL